ncbi:hypothetical protein UC8_55990 [Roseimaritima ulvae]|uniref:TIR domain-containing protein n=2 Tax=Roseimaritima ulvae TaxID=980254 RepID=A0A5B9QX00_9BACT|nr:hypothetical protein UC8_55990 [Roseimaritima ulvae]
MDRQSLLLRCRELRGELPAQVVGYDEGRWAGIDCFDEPPSQAAVRTVANLLGDIGNYPLAKKLVAASNAGVACDDAIGLILEVEEWCTQPTSIEATLQPIHSSTSARAIPMRNIPPSFLSHATSILGDTEEGLTGPKIVKLCNAWASKHDIDTPHASYPFDAPNKRTALFENVAAFPDSIWYAMLLDLCESIDNPSDEVEQLRRTIEERFGNSNPTTPAARVVPDASSSTTAATPSKASGRFSPKNHVFLSYCRDNLAQVSELRDKLVADGERVWWDQEILGGQDWDFEIRKAMKDSYAVVVCLSKEIEERNTSGVYPEIIDAVASYREHAPGSIFLVPVRLSECVVPAIKIDATRMLDSLQYLDLFEPGGYTNLLRSLKASTLRP